MTDSTTKPVPQEVPMPQAETVVRPIPNPLMDRFNKMPPETFRLPSGGTVYKNGEIDADVVDGEVIVYPMTTVDEITMRSPDMLFQGSAVENVFKRCMPQILKPMELLSNDVDYLLICLRMVTYGENLEIYWKCPKCGDEDDTITTSHDLRLEEDKDINVNPTYVVNLNNFLKQTKPLNSNDATFTIDLPTGEVVKLKPTTFKDMLKLYQYDPSTLSTPDEMFNFILDGIMAVIDNVNGIHNPQHIEEWGRACEAPVLEFLQKEIHSANDWGTSFDYSFKCNDCGETTVGEVPLNPIHFFTSPSVTQTKK